MTPHCVIYYIVFVLWPASPQSLAESLWKLFIWIWGQFFGVYLRNRKHGWFLRTAVEQNKTHSNSSEGRELIGWLIWSAQDETCFSYLPPSHSFRVLCNPEQKKVLASLMFDVVPVFPVTLQCWFPRRVNHTWTYLYYNANKICTCKVN